MTFLEMGNNQFSSKALSLFVTPPHVFRQVRVSLPLAQANLFYRSLRTEQIP